jgi:hypothetical protein
MIALAAGSAAQYAVLLLALIGIGITTETGRHLLLLAAPAAAVITVTAPEWGLRVAAEGSMTVLVTVTRALRLPAAVADTAGAAAAGLAAVASMVAAALLLLLLLRLLVAAAAVGMAVGAVVVVTVGVVMGILTVGAVGVLRGVVGVTGIGMVRMTGLTLRGKDGGWMNESQGSGFCMGAELVAVQALLSFSRVLVRQCQQDGVDGALLLHGGWSVCCVLGRAAAA